MIAHPRTRRLGPNQPSKRFPYRKVALILAPLLVFLVILPSAWMSDDVYISLRAAKNLLLGFGPTWNISERVQVFTHPLWMIPLTTAQWLFPGHIAPAVIGFGILFTLAAVITFARDIKPIWLIALTTVLLVSSKSFIDFSTSGLENPLLYLLAILFAHEYLGRRRIFRLALFAALAATTRADAALLFVPAFIPLLWLNWRSRTFWLEMLAGAVPLFIWEAFSLIYFGYLLPNTFYAKVYTGFPYSVLYRHGWDYLQNSWNWDKVTLPVIILGLVVGIIERNTRKLFIAAGIVIYFVALFRAGGDYMSGRFLAVPFILSLYLVVDWFQSWRHERLRYLVPVAAVLLLAAVITPRSPVFHPLTSTNLKGAVIVDQNGIADEGRYYCPWTCLYNLKKLPSFSFYQEGLQLRGQVIASFPSIGIVGYLARPQTFIVDPLALADPLLSHLPAYPNSRIGHFQRPIPAGYLASIAQKRNLINDPCVYQLYGHIYPVVSGPIVSLHRIKTIAELNLGLIDKQYRRCVQNRVQHHLPVYQPV